MMGLFPFGTTVVSHDGPDGFMNSCDQKTKKKVLGGGEEQLWGLLFHSNKKYDGLCMAINLLT